MTCHPAFQLKRTETIESLGIDVQEYVHTITGALHYHIAADNQENVFLVAFRTVPEDNCGVAHILEHTALCGSSRYPSRFDFTQGLGHPLFPLASGFVGKGNRRAKACRHLALSD